MDILSLAKANKAKRAIKKVNERIGTGIGMSYGSAKKRIEFLESKDPKVNPSARVSALEAQTHINLNKHNLRVEALVNKGRLQMKEAIVDDFEDATGLDLTSSVNVTHDTTNHLLKPTNVNVEAIAVLKKESLITPATMMTVSVVSSGGSTKTMDIDMSKGTFEGMQFLNGALSLIPVGQEFTKQGSWVSEAIVFDNTIDKVKELRVTKTTGDVVVSYATSNDGVTWSSFIALPADGALNVAIKGLKIKVEMNATVTIQPERIVQDFLAAEATQFEETSGVIFDGALKPITTKTDSFIVDSSFTEGGELASVAIPVDLFKTIEKLEVI